MRQMKRRVWGYGVAVVAVALAFASVFIPHLGKGFGNLLFLAVLISAWYGGYGPGLFATGLTFGVALWVILWNNNGSIPPPDVFGLLSFAIGGVVISILVEALHTAVRRAEASNARLSAVLTGIGDAVIATDGQGQVTFTNPVARDLTGWEESEAVGRPLDEVFQILSEATREPVESPVARVLSEGVVVGLGNHTILIDRSGKERPIDDSAAPIRDESEEISGVVLVFRDVTERRQAEQAADEANRRMIEILDSIADASFALDLEGKFTYVNPRWESYFGMSRDEVVGHVIWELFPNILGTPIEDHYRRVLRDRVAVSFETLSPYKQSWIEVRAFPSSNGMFSYIHDISVRKEAEDALLESDRRKDEFLAMLAHELRNPLAAISNAVQLFRRFDEREHMEWAKEVIDRQVRHLARLVDDLLDVSRITQGKIHLRRQPLDASSIIESASDAVRPLIEERKHRLSVSHARGTLWVEADPTRLEQMLVNLLTNAAKYTESGGEISLTAEKENGEIVFRVRDTGVGISPELLSRVFDLFAQGDRTLARSEGGLGIGLTLVRTLAEIHGGAISAASQGAGKGSEFTLRLPAIEKPAAMLKSAQPQDLEEKGRSRILIVDDNVDTVRGLARLLKLLGHDVVVAHDGPTAIGLAKSAGPSTILLDIGLPGMDGYEVAEVLRSLDGCKNAVLIAISGYGQDDDRRRSKQAGFDHHLVKPIDPDSLLSLIA